MLASSTPRRRHLPALRRALGARSRCHLVGIRPIPSECTRAFADRAYPAIPPAAVPSALERVGHLFPDAGHINHNPSLPRCSHECRSVPTPMIAEPFRELARKAEIVASVVVGPAEVQQVHSSNAVPHGLPVVRLARHGSSPLDWPGRRTHRTASSRLGRRHSSGARLDRRRSPTGQGSGVRRYINSSMQQSIANLVTHCNCYSCAAFAFGQPVGTRLRLACFDCALPCRRPDPPNGREGRLGARY